MKFISRDTDYAIRALVFMAKSLNNGVNSIITVYDIVEKEGLPERFLRRIFQKLVKNKILASYKGKEGGFKFLRPPDRICIKDIIEIFQGKIDLTNCLLKGGICPNTKKCPLKKKLSRISSAVNKELEEVMISSLI